jgi:hypothetical protein
VLQRLSAVALLCAISVASASAWKNGTDQANQPPRFGTHDYIAFKALDRAPANVAYIRSLLTAYFIGTEALDTGKKVAGVIESGYHDSGACHCVLFDAQGTIPGWTLGE